MAQPGKNDLSTLRSHRRAMVLFSFFFFLSSPFFFLSFFFSFFLSFFLCDLFDAFFRGEEERTTKRFQEERRLSELKERNIYRSSFASCGFSLRRTMRHIQRRTSLLIYTTDQAFALQTFTCQRMIMHSWPVAMGFLPLRIVFKFIFLNILVSFCYFFNPDKSRIP